MTEFNLAKIPSHLLTNATDTISAAAAAGIASTMAPARISYRGKVWRLIDKDGIESEPMVMDADGVLTAENNGVAMDVVIVAANPHISKIYYDQPWNPDMDSAPACFSDNGLAPSDRARLPQSKTCAECPHNVWGSAINPATGKARQACNNTKKIAVVRYQDEHNTIYALGIPGASLKPYENAVKAVAGHGVKVGGIVWRVSFDRDAAFPLMKFQPIGHLDAAQMAEFEELQTHDEGRLAVGLDDKPASENQIEMRKAAFTKEVAAVGAKGLPAATVTTPAPGGFVHAPRAAQPVSPTPRPIQPPADVPEHTRRAMATLPPQVPLDGYGPLPDYQPPTPDVVPPAPAKRRGRPPKASPAPLSAEAFDAQRAEADEKAKYNAWKAEQIAEHSALGPTPPPQEHPIDIPDFLTRKVPASPADLPPATPEVDDALSRAMGIKV